MQKALDVKGCNALLLKAREVFEGRKLLDSSKTFFCRPFAAKVNQIGSVTEAGAS